MPTGDARAGAERFPATRRSLLAAVRGPDPEARRRAWNELVESYWRPVYKYLRWQWQESAEEASDLTQGFFTAALERRTLDRYDPARARFRTYLRLCLDGFVLNERKAAGRLKRGSGQPLLSLDYAGAEAELAAGWNAAGGSSRPAGPEELFHREWVRSLFSLAVGDLRRWCETSGRARQFEVFAGYDLASAGGRRTSYEALALELDLSTIQVTNYLAAARRQLRRLVLLRLRRMTASPAEYRAEARDLLGIDLAAEP
jgi:RNA polymerase sigma factor (sigma-70 family)